MRPPSDAEILELWEVGSRRQPVDRALLTLGAAFPETPYDQLAQWRLGRRNRALAQWCCRWFGRTLRAWVTCVRCDEKLEFEIDGLAIGGGAASDDEPAHQTIEVDGRTYRLPTSRDVAKAGGESDPRQAALRLVAQCRIEPDGIAEYSDEELERIGEAMAAADPMAETLLSLHCSNCGNEWQEPLDLVSFLWTEIEVRAKRLLLEVHVLARAYGWNETEVLSLSEFRRAHYLELAQS
jgi:hypothetical protein